MADQRGSRKASPRNEEPEVPLTSARDVLGSLALDALQGKRIPFTTRGKRIAALIGPEDLEKLHAMDAAIGQPARS